MKPILMRAVACECLLLVLILLAAGAQKTAPDLTTLQIDDLMNVDVTSASKKEQKISTVAAAIFAITQEDIRQETQGESQRRSEGPWNTSRGWFAMGERTAPTGRIAASQMDSKSVTFSLLTTRTPRMIVIGSTADCEQTKTSLLKV